MRAPFALPERSRHAHACEWERIDADKSGCRLCSHVHVCGYGSCKSVVQTTDALVCEITGLCIRQNNIVESAYSDEVISFGCNTPYSGDNARQDMYDDIDGFVTELLLSESAQEVSAAERSHHAARISHTIQRTLALAPAQQPGNLVDVLQTALATCAEKKRYERFDRVARLQVSAYCSQQLRSTIPICNKFLKMNIRRTDMRVVVFGLMYLMRSGICIHEICVLPSVAALHQMLPNESNLHKYHNYKSKHITDTENKFKFHLRHVSRARMHQMGVHLVR